MSWVSMVGRPFLRISQLSWDPGSLSGQRAEPTMPLSVMSGTQSWHPRCHHHLLPSLVLLVDLERELQNKNQNQTDKTKPNHKTETSILGTSCIWIGPGV